MATRGNWTRRRWLDFRQGHSIYLIFLMTFANFIIIQYALLIDRIPILSSIFGSLPIFASVFIAAYVPIAIIIGHWHRKSQMKIEQEAIFNENVMNARMWLFMLELIEGNVSEDEKTQMRNMLRRIIKKQPGLSASQKKESKRIADEEPKTF